MTAKKKDVAVELAEKMVQTLHLQRGLGENAYPLSLKRLAELTDPAAPEKTILAAVHPRRKAFSQHALLARRDVQAPVALQEDLALLAASPLLLEFLLAALGTPSNQAFSVSQLHRKVTTRLQKPFHEAVNRQMHDGLLPPTVGWIVINRAKRLFLLRDVHTRAKADSTATPGVKAPFYFPKPSLPPAAAPLATEKGDFVLEFDRVFHVLNQQAGGHNFVSLMELRQALPMPRHAFDARLRQLRLAGRYSLSAAEGRHGLSTREQEAGIVEDGTLLLYVSRKSP